MIRVGLLSWDSSFDPAQLARVDRTVRERYNAEHGHSWDQHHKEGYPLSERAWYERAVAAAMEMEGFDFSETPPAFSDEAQ